MDKSFSQAVKRELISLGLNECCSLASLSAVIKITGSLVISSGKKYIELTSETHELKYFVERLLEKLYGKTALSVTNQLNLGKTIYTYTLPSHLTDRVLNDCGIMKEGEQILTRGIDKYLLLDDCCKNAYLRGAFLGGGSIEIPKQERDKGGFYLEIAYKDDVLIEDLRQLILSCPDIAGLEVKTMERNKRFILYLKKQEGISDFIAFLGASKSVLELADIIIRRKIKADANRGTNFIKANIEKSVQSGLKQIYMIEQLISLNAFDNLPKKLKEAGQARLDNKEADLNELATILGISKSGLKHRFDSITKIVDELKGQ